MTIGIVTEAGIFCFLDRQHRMKRGMTLALAERSAPC